MESFAETQIAENIHGQIIAPVGHVLWYSPALAVCRCAHAELLAESAHISQYVPLHLLHGAVAEAMAQHAPLAGVQSLVARVVGVGRRVHEGIVELGLAHVGLESVDLLERRIRLEGHAVRAEANDGAVALMLAPEFEVPVAFPCMVELISIGDLGQEWARIFG